MKVRLVTLIALYKRFSSFDLLEMLFTKCQLSQPKLIKGSWKAQYLFVYKESSTICSSETRHLYEHMNFFKLLAGMRKT
jgi:hypothetical protein